MSEPGHLIIAGAQRCGTTAVRAWLDSYQEVQFASDSNGEPKWFLKPDSVSLGASAYRESLWPGMDFGGADVPQWLGDKSTSYVEVPGVAARIDATLNHVRVIIVLRDPVDRAVSNYHFSRASGLETRPIDVALDPATAQLSESSAIEASGASVSPFAYLERSRYADHLQPWIDRFGPGRLRVVLLEDLLAEPAARGDLLDFLAIETAADQSLPHVGRDIGGASASSALRTRLSPLFDASNRKLAALIDNDLSGWPQH